MSDSPTILRKVGLAVIKDRKMMMVHNRKHPPTQFSTLGGKFDEGEDDIACLVREVKEEANTEVQLDSLEFLGEFEGAVVGRENTFVSIRLYKGELVSDPEPSAEIDVIEYFDSRIPQDHLTPTSEKIFKWLKENNYID